MIRLCCMKEHSGVQCLDGLVMCCHCFGRFPVEKLSKTEKGDPVDVCQPCRDHEIETMKRLKRENNT